MITNFAPRVLPGWGLDYEELKKIKPDIIMVTLPAFGSIGPDKDYVSYASTIEAVGGLNISFGYPGEPPVLSGTYPADPIGGVYGVAAFMAALIYRNRNRQRPACRCRAERRRDEPDSGSNHGTGDERPDPAAHGEPR